MSLAKKERKRKSVDASGACGDPSDNLEIIRRCDCDGESVTREKQRRECGATYYQECRLLSVLATTSRSCR